MRGVLLLMSLLLGLVSGAMAEVCRPGARSGVLKADPVTQLQDLNGSEFDLTYMRVMYQLHSDMRQLAAQAIEKTSGRDLRILSDGIKHEQMDQNAKLAAWYKQATGDQLSDYCVQSNPDYARLQTVLPQDYNNAYATTMIAYLQHDLYAAEKLL